MGRPRVVEETALRLKKNIEAAREVASVRRRKLPEGRIGNVCPYVARVEVVGDIKDLQRQAQAKLLRNLELFSNFRINCKKRGKARRAGVSNTHEILFRIAH